MVNDAAGENDPVGLGGNTVDRHLGSPARLAAVNHVFQVSRVMIDHFHPPADPLAAELFHLRFGIETMAAHDDQDGNMVFRHTGLSDRVEKGGQDEIHALPAPGNIAYGNGHFISGTKQLFEGR